MDKPDNAKQEAKPAVAPAESILTQLYNRRAAITADKFAEPPMELAEDDHVVTGVFTDELKQTYTLFCQLSDEHVAIMKKADDILQQFKSRSTFAALKEYIKGDGPDIDVLKAEHDAVHKLRDLAKDIFWTDLRAAFPELADKNKVGVRKGWVVCWSDDGLTDASLDVLINEFLEHLEGGGRRGFGFGHFR